MPVLPLAQSQAAASTPSTILVHAGSSKTSEALVGAAVGVANALNARLLGVSTPPCSPENGAGPVTAAQREAEDLIVQGARARFESLGATVRAGTAWCAAEGPPATALARLAAAADLIMTNIRVPTDGSAGDGRLKSLVVEGGRPVLVRPPSASETDFREVVVLWDGSAACARAIAAALPFMARAGRTTLLVESNRWEGGAADRLDDLRRGLALRNITVGVQAVDHGVGRDRSHRAATRTLAADLLVFAGWRSNGPWLGLSDDTDAVVAELTTFALISH